MTDEKDNKVMLTPEEFDKAYDLGKESAEKFLAPSLKKIEEILGEPPSEDYAKDIECFIRNSFITNAIENKKASYEEQEDERRDKNDNNEHIR